MDRTCGWGWYQSFLSVLQKRDSNSSGLKWIITWMLSVTRTLLSLDRLPSHFWHCHSATQLWNAHSRRWIWSRPNCAFEWKTAFWRTSFKFGPSCRGMESAATSSSQPERCWPCSVETCMTRTKRARDLKASKQNTLEIVNSFISRSFSLFFLFFTVRNFLQVKQVSWHYFNSGNT